jgi:ABC-2 type transport system permease protein
MNDSTGGSARRRQHPLLCLIIARLHEFLREPEAIFWVYVFPLLLVVALGVAFRNRPIEAVRVGVEQGGPADAIVDVLNRDAHFRATLYDEQADRLELRAGRVDLVVVASGQAPEQYEYRFDPTRTESVLARQAVDDLLQRAAGRHDAVATRDHPTAELGGRYIDFLVPGLLGMGLMGGGLWGVGYVVVDMRIRKLLKRYLATPMKRHHFLAAVIVSRLLFTLPEVVLLLVFSQIVFGVTSAGSYLAILVLILLGALEFSGIGLLVASRASTIETVSGLMNAVMLPMYIASGVFFPTERFPDAVQPALVFLPLTPLIHALRSVMLEGASLWSLGSDVALIAAWAGVTLALAIKWFRWS